MLHSFRFRLLITTALVVLVAVSITAVFATQRTAREFDSYVQQVDRFRQRRFSSALARAYARTGSWQDIQPVIDQWQQMTDDRVVVADAGGWIVGDSSGELAGKTVGDKWPQPSGAVLVDGVQVGAFYVNPFEQTPLVTQDFLNNINRSILLGALTAGLVAVIVTLFVSHRIVQPIESLTSAARRMEKGDLAARVQVGSGDEIGQLAHAFNAMADGLARQEQLRRNMVTDVAHELRAPLTNIRGYLAAAKDGLVEPDAALVDNLYEEARLLNRLVNDLQELALAEAGQLHLELCPLQLGEVVLATVEAFEPRAEARSISLQADVPPDLPLVTADPHRVGEVLHNLINNALDFTPREGQVVVSVRPNGEWVNVQVHDSGPGIPPEHLPFIFERFYRVDPSRARATGGAGLGLAIVKQLVQAHGGRVWAESEPGAGATFGFSLPLASN